MHMATTKLKRQIWLISLLTKRRRVTYQDIQDAWSRSALYEDLEKEYSKRTFLRDKDEILDLFNIHIKCSPSAPYHYSVDQNMVDDIQVKQKWLLQTISTFNAISEGRTLKHRLQLENAPSGETYLTDIISAMRQNTCLIVKYQCYWQEGQLELVLEPYALKYFRRRWYLLARPSGGSYPKIYSLDRILELSSTELPFQMPKDFDAEDYWHSSYGVMVDEEYDIEEIRLRAYGVRVRYLDDLPLHHSQTKVAEGDGWAEYTLRLRASLDFQQELMSCATELEVLQPAWLRQDMAKNLSKALGLYTTDFSL